MRSKSIARKKIGTTSWSVAENSQVSRRQFITYAGMSTAAVWIYGCGGGSGGSGGPGGGGGSGLSRTVVTGSTKNQINQFSLASEEIGNLWEGSSTAISDLQTFASANRSAHRSAGNSNLMFVSTWYALQGLKSGYERLLNGYLAGDDQGSVSETVSANANLDSNSTLINPQWLAAMMLQMYSAARVSGAIIKIIQISGIQSMTDWVNAQTTDTNKLIAYGIFADTYNTWLDTVAKADGIAALSTLKLDVSSSISPSTIAAALSGLPAKLITVPFTPGVRLGGVVTGVPVDSQLTGLPQTNFALSLLGTLAQITLSPGGPITSTFVQTVDVTKAKYDFATRLSTTGLGKTITTSAGSGSSAQTAVDTLVLDLMTNGLPGGSGAAATFAVQLAVGSYDLINAVAQAILSEHSLVGAALDGQVALDLLNAVIALINAKGSTVQKQILSSVSCDINYLQSTYLVGGQTYALRTIPAAVIPAIETDQVNGILQISCQNALCYPAPNAGWKGTPFDKTIPLFRGIDSGLPTINTGVARTFNNVEVASAGLFYDFLYRNSGDLRPDLLTSGQIIFCCSNFARLLRRAPGANNAHIASITAAALLCSAPNFTPSKEKGPVDLTSLAALSNLNPITDLAQGVLVNVQ